MKQLILMAACLLSSVVASAQSLWSVTPEAGVVVNKENETTRVALGFKAGVGVTYQMKEAVGYKPAFGWKSGLFVLQQKGVYHPMSWGNIPIGDGSRLESSYTEATRYYLQLPVMAQWGFRFCDDVKLNLAVGPYVAVGIAGHAEVSLSSSKSLPGTSEAGRFPYEYRYDYIEFNPFKGKKVNGELSMDGTTRFDWGGTASAGITVKRVSFNIGYDMAWGQFLKEQNDLRIRNHMVSFTLGYTL